MAYYIISIEGRDMRPEGRVLFVKANLVKDAGDGFRFMEEMFGKKYFKYAQTECDETVSFVFPFSDEQLNELMRIHGLSQDPESIDSFWNPNMSDFTSSQVIDQETGRIMMVYKQKSFNKPEYEFCIFTEVLPATVNGERVFLVHANRTEVGNREAFLDDFSQAKICYFVLALSEYNRFKEETAHAFWRPDLSHYYDDELKMSGVNRFTGEQFVEKRYMYISREVSRSNIMDNLNKLPL